VSVVASAITNGTFTNRAKVLASNVFPVLETTSRKKKVKLVARRNKALTIFQRNGDGRKQKSQTRLLPPSISKNL
jgi:hypothetical protein